MTCQNFAPSLPLRPYIEEYSFLQSSPGALLTESLPPGGRSSLLVNLGTSCLVNTHTLPALAIGGQSTHTMQLTQQVGCQILMITFRTTGFSWLFGLPMRESTNQVLDIEAVFPLAFRQRWRSVLDQLKQLNSIRDRIQLIEAQLLVYVNRMPTHDGGWVEEASRLLAYPGNRRVQPLATVLRISPRQLSREFTRQVGISPKSFAQVMRFRHVFRAAHTQSHLTWLDLVHLGGWYDQAHFCNDLYEITGLTPSDFFAQHPATTGMLINNHDTGNRPL